MVADNWEAIHHLTYASYAIWPHYQHFGAMLLKVCSISHSRQAKARQLFKLSATHKSHSVFGITEACYIKGNS